ncbi:MAG: hypothetical protein KIT56_09960 [Gammaproteobacteria bacterium]|nr:hypothetical protein [Flavobacteriaceae bacterium]MCW5584174.1 hypothetical protein [Gammaproteobacteria bacterium]
MKKYFIFFVEKFTLFIGLFAIAPFIIISAYNHPMSDDFCLTNTAREIGSWNMQWDLYFTWTGRYFSTFLISFNPLVFDFYNGYKLIPIALLILTILSIYKLIDELYVKGSFAEKASLSFFFVFIFIFQIPDIRQGFYWLSGATTYQVANILTILLITSIIKIVRTGKAFHKFMSFVLVFCIIGCNETSMLLTDFLLLLVISYLFYIKFPIRFFLMLLVFSVFFSFLVYLAPGNVIREAYFPQSHNFVSAVFLFFPLFR